VRANARRRLCARVRYALARKGAATPVVVTTERLVLRTWAPEDRSDLIGLLGEPEIVRWLNVGVPFATEEIDAFLDRQTETARLRGWCRWALQLREPSQDDPAGVVGFCGFGCAFAPDVELGWTLAPAMWGRGLATEAAEAALDYGFRTIGFTEIISAVLPDNVRSRRIAEKIGEVVRGTVTHDGLRHLRYAAENPGPLPLPEPGIRRDCL